MVVISPSDSRSSVPLADVSRIIREKVDARCAYSTLFSRSSWWTSEFLENEKWVFRRGVSPAAISPPVRSFVRREKRRDWTNSYSWRRVNVTIGNAFIRLYRRQGKGDRPRKHGCKMREHARRVDTFTIGVFAISRAFSRSSRGVPPKRDAASKNPVEFIDSRSIRLKFLSANAELRCRA